MSVGERRSQRLDVMRPGYWEERVDVVWESSSLLLSRR